MQARIKVLFLNHVSQMGGAEAGLLDMVKCLDPDRFDCRVALPPGGPLVDALARRNVQTDLLPLRRFRRTRNPAALAAYAASLATVVPRLVRLLKAGNADVLHANSNTAQIYGGPAARLAGIPSVWHSRDLVPLGILGPRLYGLCSRAIAISDAVAQHLRAHGAGGSKLVTIPNGLDVDRFQPHGHRQSARTRLGLGAEDVVFTTIGQLVPWKNHRLFLECAARVARQLDNARFLIVGGDLFAEQDDYRRNLERLAAELDLGRRVRFTGYCADVVPLLEASDVVVHPAEREPFGRAVGEAMALGKPVVAVDSCGPRQLIRNGVDGLLVPPGNPEAMAAACLRLTADPPLASRIGRAARARIASEFSLDQFGDRLETLYEDVIGEARV